MPQARPAFELLRFTAAPVGDALALVDVEGRFGVSGRFARRPALVVEPPDGERLELSPVHVDAEGERWRAAYAVPVASLADARFGLALRGTLVELPAPDRLEGTAGSADRTVELAREANALRRQLERAEAQAAQAEDHAEAAEDRAAAAEERAAGAQARIGVVERAVRELEQRILVAEGEAEEAERRAEVARERARRAEDDARAARQEAQAASDRAEEAERRLAGAAEAQERLAAVQRRAAEAQERAEAAEQRAQAAGEGLDVLRGELAEERARGRRLEPEREAMRPPVIDEDLFEDDDADDDDRDDTPPGGIVRTRVGTRVGAVAAPRPAAPPVHHHRTSAGPERWLAALALVILIAVLVAFVIGLRG